MLLGDRMSEGLWTAGFEPKGFVFTAAKRLDERCGTWEITFPGAGVLAHQELPMATQRKDCSSSSCSEACDRRSSSMDSLVDCATSAFLSIRLLVALRAS